MRIAAKSLPAGLPGAKALSDKDRLIVALAAQLRAERETRDTLAAVIRNGQLDPEVLSAILSDPVPAETQDDLVQADLMHADALAGASPRREAA